MMVTITTLRRLRQMMKKGLLWVISAPALQIGLRDLSMEPYRRRPHLL